MKIPKSLLCQKLNSFGVLRALHENIVSINIRIMLIKHASNEPILTEYIEHTPGGLRPFVNCTYMVGSGKYVS